MKRHRVGRSGKKRKLTVERVPVKGGAPLFRVSDEAGNRTYVRAASPALAKVSAEHEIERQGNR